MSSDKDTLPSSPWAENAVPPDAPESLPPNGGRTAWLQVVGGFLFFFNSWGVINTFGVYQTYYEQDLLSTFSASSISWIGTVQGCLILLGGMIVGPIFDKGHLRRLLIFGTFCVVFGLMMTSLASQYYQIFLAQGVLVGVGCAFEFLPSVAIVATYFTTRRAFATGIVASGGSIGAVIYPIVFHRLIGRIGYGWTTRVIAFLVLAGNIFALAVMKMRKAAAAASAPVTSRPLVDLSAFYEPPFVLLCLGLFFAFVGLYLPFFYLPTFFQTSLHNNGSIAFYSIAILNAASVFGRITPGLLADRFGSVNTILPISFAATVLAFAWIGIHNLPGTIVFAVLYGYASGALVSLPPTILTRITPHMSVVGTRLGMVFAFGGIGILIGNPIAGALLDLKTGLFWKGQLFAAVALTVSTVFLFLMRLFLGKHAQGWKI